MPWGKFHGQPLVSLPMNYLAFVIEGSNAHESLRQAAIDEVRRRLAVAKPLTNHERTMSEELLQTLEGWSRRAIMRLHPDRGGSSEALALIADLKIVLEEIITRRMA